MPAKLFSEAIGAPVTVLNDADAAGVAEMEFGAGKGVSGVVIMVTLGTGIGSAVFLDGKLVPNTELGHLQIGKQRRRARSRPRACAKRSSCRGSSGPSVSTQYFQYLEALFSPDLIIVGGGVSKKADKFLPLVSTRVDIVPAQLLNEAGIVGAAVAAAGASPALVSTVADPAVSTRAASRLSEAVDSAAEPAVNERAERARTLARSETSASRVSRLAV